MSLRGIRDRGASVAVYQVGNSLGRRNERLSVGAMPAGERRLIDPVPQLLFELGTGKWRIRLREVSRG